MNARRLTLATVVLLCVLVGALALASVPASALNSYSLSSSFGEPGSGAGQLSSPGGVAVNEVTHDVYVADTGNRRVDEFSASGTFVRAWGWGVLDGLSQFEVCTVVCQAGISGHGAGQFESPAYIAVDNSSGASAGDVYVAEGGLVTKFDASGNVVSGWGSGGQLDGSTAPDGPFTSIGGIAVDSGGTLLVSGVYQNVFVLEFAQDGSFTSEFTAPYLFTGSGFAVDAADDLFGVTFGGVVEYTSAGSTVGRVSGSGAPTGLAVDSATRELLVDLGGHVEQYVFPSRGEVSEPDGSTCITPSKELYGEPGCGATGLFGRGVLSGGAGIAVDSTDGTVYVADAGKIDVFTMPVLVGEWASDVSSTGATVNAIVNPLRSSTQYTFEYGLTSSYGKSVSGNVGEGLGDVDISPHLQELSPGTVYHYRIVTHSTIGTFESVDRTFTTQPAAVEGESTLPDGRAWELVSPQDKNGASLGFATEGGNGLVQAAGDGSGIAYQSNEPVGAGIQGRGFTQQMLSVRSPQGWSTRDLAIPRALSEEAPSGAAAPEYGLFSSDLSVGLLDRPPSGAETPLSPEATRKTALYLHDDASGSYSPLFVEAEGEAREAQFRAATSDLSHVVLSSELALTPEAISEPCLNCQASRQNLYEWSAGHLALVNFLPGGKPSHPGVTLGGDEVYRGFGLGVHALSSDGRWIAWVDEGGPSSGLYVRDMVGRRTERIGGSDALFQSMSSDGSKVFFLEGGDLHVFETGSETSSDLTAGHGAEPTAGVEETVLTNEDGSYVYFRATGVLAAGGVSGAQNLYVLHGSGGVWTTGFIASLSSEDGPSWYAEGFGGAVNLAGVSSRVSPDGRYLAFMSNGSLTSYDNTDAISRSPDEEVYLYDAVAARLVCASCNPSGARPVGVLDGATVATSLLVDPTDVWGGHWLAGSIPGWSLGAKQTSAYQSRYLSDSGRLFFDSPDALVAQDSNGVEDAYEYEPSAVGDCTGGGSSFSVRSDGCVSLLSSGTSAAESAFLDASENGNDVFFVTASRLSTADYDNSYDVYDARVCTAETPCLAPPVSPPPCTSGDSCKAAPSAQPELFGPAPSATFSGTGNVLSQPSAVVRAKALTRSQKLARALAVCHKEKRKTRKVVCERAAKKRYSAKQSRGARATRGGKR